MCRLGDFLGSFTSGMVKCVSPLHKMGCSKALVSKEPLGALAEGFAASPQLQRARVIKQSNTISALITPQERGPSNRLAANYKAWSSLS